MTFDDLRPIYVFPRIPLNLPVSGEYPDIGNVSSVSVVPEIKNIRAGRSEIEIKGSYSLAISYFKSGLNSGAASLAEAARADEFFSFLKVQSDGFLNEDEAEESNSEDNSGELYTVDFVRPFHTFIDVQSLNRPRNFKPAMVVQKVNITGHGGRKFKGELVMAMVNLGKEKHR